MLWRIGSDQPATGFHFTRHTSTSSFAFRRITLYRSLVSSAYDVAKLRVKRTSGSTGVPLTIYCDEPAMQWKTACTIRSDEWSGYRLGQRVAKVWGNPEYRHFGLKGRLRNYLFDRAVYLDTVRTTRRLPNGRRAYVVILRGEDAKVIGKTDKPDEARRQFNDDAGAHRFRPSPTGVVNCWNAAARH